VKTLTPPPYRILIVSRFQVILFFFGFLRTKDYVWSAAIFEFRQQPKIPTEMRRGALLMLGPLGRIYKKNIELLSMELFPVLKIMKIATFMTRKPKTRFLSFGLWAIILVLIVLFINVAYFFNCLFNALLLTYQAVPSSIYDFCPKATFRLVFVFWPQKRYFEIKKKTADQIESFVLRIPKRQGWGAG